MYPNNPIGIFIMQGLPFKKNNDPAGNKFHHFGYFARQLKRSA
jgi:hypothetical protein